MGTRTELGLGILALALIASACSPSDSGREVSASVDSLLASGNEALAAGDSISAQTKFDAALHRMLPDDAKFVEAKVGLIRARVSAYASIAVEEFLLLAKARPDSVGDLEFRLVADQMARAGKEDETFKLVLAGTEHFGEKEFLSLAESLMSAGRRCGAIRLLGVGIEAHGNTPALLAQFWRIRELVEHELEGSGRLRSIACEF